MAQDRKASGMKTSQAMQSLHRIQNAPFGSAPVFSVCSVFPNTENLFILSSPWQTRFTYRRGDVCVVLCILDNEIV